MTSNSYWRCPACFGSLQMEDQELFCIHCDLNFGTHRGVIRFLDEGKLADSFGFQWSTFPQVQLDSATGDSRSEQRFVSETNWGENVLKDNLVLDAGCGSGRFSEIALRFGANLVMVDASDSIYATKNNLSDHTNATFVKATLLNLPFKDNSFDFVYCIGVLQHTSNPFDCIEELARVTKVGGGLALTFYEKSGWWTKLYSKYLIRHISKRIPKHILMKIISMTSLVWFPVSKTLFKLPGVVGKIFRFVIPVANYVEFEYSRVELQKSEAILDTFDMLSPEFDEPLIKSEVQDRLVELGFTILSSPLKGNVQARKISKDGSY